MHFFDFSSIGGQRSAVDDETARMFRAFVTSQDPEAIQRMQDLARKLVDYYIAQNNLQLSETAQLHLIAIFNSIYWSGILHGAANAG